MSATNGGGYPDGLRADNPEERACTRGRRLRRKNSTRREPEQPRLEKALQELRDGRALSSIPSSRTFSSNWPCTEFIEYTAELKSLDPGMGGGAPLENRRSMVDRY
jgi:hypothetical protein